MILALRFGQNRCRNRSPESSFRSVRRLLLRVQGFFLDLPDVDGVFKWRASLNAGFAAWNGTGHGNRAHTNECSTCFLNPPVCRGMVAGVSAEHGAVAPNLHAHGGSMINC